MLKRLTFCNADLRLKADSDEKLTVDINIHLGLNDYARQLYRQVLLRARISYGNSVRLSVCPSRPGTERSPGEIETPGLHHMIA